MVRFPLHARNGCSCPSIADRGEFIAGFDRIFTAEARRVVAEQRIDQLFCEANGVMYGNGQVWVGLVDGETPERYGVTQVSVGECDPRPPGKRVTLLRCVTGRRWHHVDWTGRQYRYRGGLLGSTKPSRTLLGGVETSEGTGAFRYELWTFQTDSGGYQLSNMNSFGESPPETQLGTFAELEVGQEIGIPLEDCLAP